MAGIYVHLPFCRKKCFYCDFAAYAHQEKRIESYMASLGKELQLTAEKLKETEWSTLYFGGGTPSLIAPNLLSAWMEEFLRYYAMPTGEITLETNIEDLNRKYIEAWKAIGINRLSIGLQSTHQFLVEACGRTYCTDWKERIREIRRAGLDNFSVDLMVGLPGQKLAHVKRDLQALQELEIPHFSVYSLILEEKTYYAYLEEKNELKLPDEDLEREMMTWVREYLKDQGYTHYEISNFALPGYESVHNTSYWKRIPYIGLGLAAASQWENQRWTNTKSLMRYLRFENLDEIREEKEILTPLGEKSEALILGLRLIDGVNLDTFEKRYGESPFISFGEAIEKHLKNGLLKIENGYLSFTKKGLDLGDIVNRDLVCF